MRKFFFAIVLILTCSVMSGCFIKNVPLTNGERNAIAQYAADVLLKHDRNYSGMLLSAEKLTPTPTPTPKPDATSTPVPTETPTPTPTAIVLVTPTGEPGTEPTKAADVTPGPETTPGAEPTKTAEVTSTPTPIPTPTDFPDNTEFTNLELTNVMGLPAEVRASYTGTSEPVESFHMGDSATALQKIEGVEYLIVRFDIVNNSSETVNLNTAAQKLRCTLLYNDGQTQPAETTLFTNDLRFIGVSDDNAGENVAPGKSYLAVLVFRVEKGLDITKAAISIINSESEAVIIKIK